MSDLVGREACGGLALTHEAVWENFMQTPTREALWLKKVAFLFRLCWRRGFLEEAGGNQGFRRTMGLSKQKPVCGKSSGGL